MPSAILLIAHGSRRTEANQDLIQVADALRTRLPWQIVEMAYLELAQPDIPTGLKNCVQHGADIIRMLPYFLSAGAHVTDDLEEHRVAFQIENPLVETRLCPPLGLHPLLIDVLVERSTQTFH